MILQELEETVVPIELDANENRPALGLVLLAIRAIVAKLLHVPSEVPGQAEPQR